MGNGAGEAGGPCALPVGCSVDCVVALKAAPLAALQMAFIREYYLANDYETLLESCSRPPYLVALEGL